MPRSACSILNSAVAGFLQIARRPAFLGGLIQEALYLFGHMGSLEHSKFDPAEDRRETKALT
jgi:hypothetical protein